ncbi:hypothetical protein [Jannaschia sp. 2305UL9-9]|uniref:hypothetical protein n=1 Tax=Jannaschia sp. 2305UL9-9 TaxID=3121638 RepID=UPI003526F319
MENNIFQLATMLHGASGRFLKSFVDDSTSAEQTAALWNDLDTVMLELRREVAKVVGD